MDKGVLLKRKAADRVETVELDDGVAVTVRALSHGEAKELREANSSAHTYDHRMIARALVDPVMTPAEVGEWLDDAPAGDSVTVEKAIIRLSGMGEGAQKSDVAGVPTGS